MSVDPGPVGPVPAAPRLPTPVLGHDQLARLAGSRFAQVVQLAETTSTNSVLVGSAEGGAPEGMVVVADYQTAGRGRFDRRWESPRGNRSCSRCFFAPAAKNCRRARRHLAVAAVSLALVEAARDVANVAVQLKWPNDLIVRDGTAGDGTAANRTAGDKKVAGVLAEATSDGAIIVGAGVNVAWAPAPLERSGAPAATCLGSVAGRPVQRGELLVERAAGAGPPLR